MSKKIILEQSSKGCIILNEDHSKFETYGYSNPISQSLNESIDIIKVIVGCDWDVLDSSINHKIVKNEIIFYK